jgi:hypothetical protein
MLDVVRLLSDLPSVLVHRAIGLGYMLVLYALVLLVVIVAYRKMPKRSEILAEEASQSFQ